MSNRTEDLSRYPVMLAIDSLGSGGAQRQLVTLATGMVRAGIEINLFNYYPQYNHFREELEVAGVRIFDVAKRSRFDLAPPLALRRALRKSEARTLISFLDTPNIYALLAAAGTGIRTIASERSTFVTEQLSRRTRAKYWAYRAADAVVVNSFHQAEKVRRLCQWKEPTLKVIWNGIDLHRFSPHTESEKFGGTLRLLGVGSQLPGKNIEGVLRALALVREEGRDIVVHWAGKTLDTAEGRRTRQKCNELIETLHLAAHWQWLGERRNMDTVYGQYDALIHASFYEGLPNAICEALACGLPVLASNVCDHARLIKERERGHLFDPSQPSDIARAISEHGDLDTGQRQQMGSAAREFAQSFLSIERYVEAYCDLVRGRSGVTE